MLTNLAHSIHPGEDYRGAFSVVVKLQSTQCFVSSSNACGPGLRDLELVEKTFMPASSHREIVLLLKNVNWMWWLDVFDGTRDILKICDFNENYRWKWFKIGTSTILNLGSVQISGAARGWAGQKLMKNSKTFNFCSKLCSVSERFFQVFRGIKKFLLTS